jgi:DUF1680 family protein
MKQKLLLFFFTLFLGSWLWSQDSVEFGDYPITPSPFSKVQLQDAFWSKRIQVNHEITIPIAYHQSEKTGRIDNFKKAAGIMTGPFGTQYPFDDSDVYKIIEAASYSLQIIPDKEMDRMLDSLIYFMSEAQEEDGYLFTSRTIKEGDTHPWNGDERWVNVNELSHELYNQGHLFEAAVAHYTSTGKTSLLNVAIKSADLIAETFGPDKIQNYPGHQEVEIGLVKLYRITQNKKYLDLAKFFLDIRGREGVGRQDPYNQSHMPVVEQTRAVGHAVRAAYMWTAMADVAAITGNQDYMTAINTLWEDVTGSQYYINGGIGSTKSHEGFGGPYVLPNMTAYNETCAGVGNVTWNHRMFLMTGESKYIDILERTMFNNILAGVSISGDHFFYPNPLSSDGQYERSEWFGCACCPPNVARFLPSMPGYIYAQQNENIYVNLFISSETTFELPGGTLTLAQKSGMPWLGEVGFDFIVQQPVRANLKLRIPCWARNKPVPGELYHYADEVDYGVRVRLNGKVQDVGIDKTGYINLTKEWTTNDRVEITIPFEDRIVAAHDNVEEDRNKIAVERGPLLYCAEGIDNEGEVLHVVLDEEPVFTATYEPDLLGGIVTLHGRARKVKRSADGNIELSDNKPLKLIPYHLWNNRGPGEMRVWLPVSVSGTLPKADP